MEHTISKKLNISFDEAVKSLSTALKNEGFGVITEVNLQEKFKEKLNIDFRRYTIFGACNPALAYDAIKLEPTIGVMLPCNVLVQEAVGGGVDIAAVNPLNSIGAIDNSGLQSLAKTVTDKLRKALDSF